MNRNLKVATARLAGIALGLGALGIATLTEQADAAPSTVRVVSEPYGGCDEAWRYSNTPGARDCRRLGWTIRPHFTIDPHNRLRATDLPPCKFEDSSGCHWNARKRGNGRGDSYVVSKRGEVFYVSFGR